MDRKPLNVLLTVLDWEASAVLSTLINEGGKFLR